MSQARFAKSVVTMMVGTSIAQLIPIAASPLLSRLYTPDQFGTLGVFTAIVSLVALLGTGRYELSIMLPDDEATSAHIGAFAICMALAVCAIAGFIAWLSSGTMLHLLGDPTVKDWLWLLPVSSLLMAAIQVFNYRLNRAGLYKSLAWSSVFQQLAAATVAIAFGIFGPKANWLIVGLVGGQCRWMA